ncbi:hypothetical protein O9H85_25800 [Paenibacillus filicis]|uniref:Uncharacterized protein n=1 Tax=Paenibacillus gyeongsangnamensis TaxID=3388067 RepID=A0ABT4QFU7_9BACL|nr:hypothetical protein [Paenibacillus filicis]MCZ8515764.1 hypothetical protein [Paenibacillus filicis]
MFGSSAFIMLQRDAANPHLRLMGLALVLYAEGLMSVNVNGSNDLGGESSAAATALGTSKDWSSFAKTSCPFNCACSKHFSAAQASRVARLAQHLMVLIDDKRDERRNLRMVPQRLISGRRMLSV